MPDASEDQVMFPVRSWKKGGHNRIKRIGSRTTTGTTNNSSVDINGNGKTEEISMLIARTALQTAVIVAMTLKRGFSLYY